MASAHYVMKNHIFAVNYFREFTNYVQESD